jgi:osmotically-inducible protein OsmY
MQMINCWSNKFRLLLLLSVVITLQGCAEAVVVGGMGGLVAMHDARTVKGRFQDRGIEKAARRAISRDPQLQKNVDINITSFNGAVLMTGQAKTKALKKRAASLVAGIGNVARVHDEVAVVPRLDNSWSSDSYMTARVKARLFFRDFDGTRVKVVSESGNVYLMGLLSRAESDDVIAMVADVDGIRSVTRVFEYVD